MQLSRFALYVIPDEKKEAKKCKRGLNLKIRNWVMYLEVKNFVGLVNKASIAEKGPQGNHNTKGNSEEEAIIPRTTTCRKRTLKGSSTQ